MAIEILFVYLFDLTTGSKFHVGNNKETARSVYLYF